jgi:VIT1/CCC1 family predicted Fe2+/Mn2+ transporter
MEKQELPEHLYREIIKAQQNEITEHHVYKNLARIEKNRENRTLLNRISDDELRHYRIWKAYTEKNIRPSRVKIWGYYIMALIFGITFCIKMMEGNENQAQINYDRITRNIPDAKAILDDAERHERELMAMLDEERLRYVGAIVRGLNEALIELTAVLSGLTLALHNSNYIALTGVITGVAMSFSLGGTENLATKSESNNQHPLKAALYTGFANFITVIFLIYPYLIFENAYISLAFMLVSAVIIIYVFNFHRSVTGNLSLNKSFKEMLTITFIIALLSFAIGYLARTIFHIEH